MKEYICKEVPTENGGYLETEKELIRCRDCKNWKQTEEGVGECVIFNTGDYRFRSTADFFCNMAERKVNDDNN